MAGVVLALAGLTYADGGPGLSAATAPVWSAAGRWVGTRQSEMMVKWDIDPEEFEWDNERGEYTTSFCFRKITIKPAHFVPLGGGKMLLQFDWVKRWARYEWREGQLRIYDRGTVYSLCPAPHKP